MRLPHPMPQARRRSVVPSAAAACTSSCASKGPAAGAKRRQLQRGSTPHDRSKRRLQFTDGRPSQPLKGWRWRRSPNGTKSGLFCRPTGAASSSIMQSPFMESALPHLWTQKRQLNAKPRNFEASAQPIDVGFAGQAGAMRRSGGRSWRPPSQDRTAWARIRRQR